MEATFTLLKIMRFEILKVLVPSIDRFLFYGTSGYLEYDNTQSLFECTYKYDKCKDLSYTKCKTKCFTKQTSLRIIERIHKKKVKKEKHDNTRPSYPRQTLSFWNWCCVSDEASRPDGGTLVPAVKWGFEKKKKQQQQDRTIACDWKGEEVKQWAFTHTANKQDVEKAHLWKSTR